MRPRQIHIESFDEMIEIGLCLDWNYFRPRLHRLHLVDLLHCYQNFLGFEGLRCYKNYLSYLQQHIESFDEMIEIGLCLDWNYFRPRHHRLHLVDLLHCYQNFLGFEGLRCYKNHLCLHQKHIESFDEMIEIGLCLDWNYFRPRHHYVSTILSCCIATRIFLVLKAYVVTRIICVIHQKHIESFDEMIEIGLCLDWNFISVIVIIVIIVD